MRIAVNQIVLVSIVRGVGDVVSSIVVWYNIID